MTRSRLVNLRCWQIVLLGLGLGLAVTTVVQLNLQATLLNLLQMGLRWVQSLGPTGVIAFMLLYNVATLLFIPSSLLTLGAGVLYGLVWGSIYVVVAATLGAILAFLIGRYFARAWVSRWLQQHPCFQAIDQAVAREGLKIVLLTRLSPLFPFNLLNYLFGVTCVSLKDYTIGSIGIIPGTILYVYIGVLIGDLAMLTMPQLVSPQAQSAQWFAKIAGLLFTGVSTIAIARIARTALRQRLPPLDNHQSENKY